MRIGREPAHSWYTVGTSRTCGASTRRNAVSAGLRYALDALESTSVSEGPVAPDAHLFTQQSTRRHPSGTQASAYEATRATKEANTRTLTDRPALSQTHNNTSPTTTTQPHTTCTTTQTHRRAGHLRVLRELAGGSLTRRACDSEVEELPREHVHRHAVLVRAGVEVHVLPQHVEATRRRQHLQYWRQHHSGRYGSACSTERHVLR